MSFYRDAKEQESQLAQRDNRRKSKSKQGKSGPRIPLFSQLNSGGETIQTENRRWRTQSPLTLTPDYVSRNLVDLFVLLQRAVRECVRSASGGRK